jgi:tripartite-type tricarboxylate transporter receptor subunit TctC
MHKEEWMLMRVRWFMLLTLALLLTLGAASVEAYPSRPVQMIVGFAAGGSTDIWARALAESLQRILAQPVSVLNVPGAGGAIGLQQAFNERADGYTLVTTGSYVTTNTLQKRVPFGLFDITHIAVVNIEPFVLVANKNAAWGSFEDFVKSAKASPGKLVFCNAGTGGLNHVAAEALIRGLNLPVRSVPFDGGTGQVNALLGGHADVGFLSQAEAVPHLSGGSLKALAVATEARSPRLPGVPTLMELGVKGVPQGPWRGLGGPKGLPQAVVDRLVSAVTQTVEDPTYIAVSDKYGYMTTLKTGAEMKAFLEEDAGIVETVLREIGLIK